MQFYVTDFFFTIFRSKLIFSTITSCSLLEKWKYSWPILNISTIASCSLHFLFKDLMLQLCKARMSERFRRHRCDRRSCWNFICSFCHCFSVSFGSSKLDCLFKIILCFFVLIKVSCFFLMLFYLFALFLSFLIWS